MKKIVAILCAMALAAPAHALTFKTGQVIGADGEVYDGASPEQQEKIVNAAKGRGEIVGMTSGNVFVIVGDTVTYIPVQEIAGKTDEGILETVGDAVVRNVTGNEDITFESVQAAQSLSEETGVPIDELVSAEGLEGLDEETLAEIQQVSQDTGVSMDNLMTLNTIIGALPGEEINEFVTELGDLVEEGFADEINDFLDEVRELGVQDLFAQYTSLEDCLAGEADASRCNAADDAINSFDQATGNDDDDDEPSSE